MAIERASPVSELAPNLAGGLDATSAAALMQAALAGALPEPRVAGILAHYRSLVPSVVETIGFARALGPHVCRLVAPAERPRPVVLPAYGATRSGPNLTALVALLLKRYRIDVLVHGLVRPGVVPGERDDATGGVATADVFRELGIEPATSLTEARARLLRREIAFVPVDVLAPGLGRLLRAGGGERADGLAAVLTRIVDPFGGDGYRVVCAPDVATMAVVRGFLAATGATALLLGGADGEPFPDSIAAGLEPFVAGVATGGDEMSGEAAWPPLPPMTAAATAAWIERVLEGELPVPAPVLALLGCCLAGVRR